jgi:hypothetical protein|tara:strand:+ start:54 stop:269 length:216 start_codon:yes stop_codon:yes gene_type:complete
MSWLSSILSILKSFFSVLDKKTLTEGEKIAKTKREEKKQVKNDWKHTQDEIDRAFDAAKSRASQRLQNNQD